MLEAVILCSVLAIIVFGIQFQLCRKCRKRVAKRLPVYVIIAFYFVSLALWLLDMLNGSGGVAIWAIFAFIIAIANTVALIADLLAWVVYMKGKKNTQ